MSQNTNAYMIYYLDKGSIDKAIEQYFKAFNWNIIKVNALHELMHIKDATAILIHHSFVNEQCKKIIKQLYTLSIPILIFDPLPDEQKCIEMLNHGADDYIAWPAKGRELHARIMAILRRMKRTMQEKKPIICFDRFKLHPSSRKLYNEQKEEIPLSSGEYDLLMLFLSKPQVVLNRDTLVQYAKLNQISAYDRRIDVQISRLRLKIEQDRHRPKLIKTIRSSGYMLTTKVSYLQNDASI